VSYIKLLMYLPDVYKIIKLIINAVKSGKSKADIKLGLAGIEEAFKISDPAKKAERLDDVFNKEIH